MRASIVCFLLLLLAATVCIALAFFIGGGSRGDTQQLQVLLAVIFVGGALTSVALLPRSEVDGALRRRWFRPLVYAAFAIVTVQMLSAGSAWAFEALTEECVVISFDSYGDTPDCAGLHTFSWVATWLSFFFGGIALAAIVPVLLGVSM